MCWKGILLIFLLIIPFKNWSQIHPKEGAELNYRLIRFSFPAETKTTTGILEIAVGNHSNADSFLRNIIYTAIAKSNKILIEVPSFGTQYSWRIVNANTGSTNTAHSELHHFSTTTIPEVDTSLTRLRVLDTAVKYTDDYVFLDGTKALYDMKGRPVWFLPGIAEATSPPIDIKLSTQNTVTFLYHNTAFEVDYNGTVLWKKQSNKNEKSEGAGTYHHEFTRLANGHYMMLGNEILSWDQEKSDAKKDGGSIMLGDTVRKNQERRHAIFGTVIEYNEKGDSVWEWKSSQYFMESDLKNFIPKNTSNTIDLHENAFYFDEKDQTIYISFKSISRVIKIKYPEGLVLNAYGEEYKPGVPQNNDYYFCDQHSCKHSPNGYLYLYNNNTCSDNPMSLPRVSVFCEPAGRKGKLEKIWEYQCTADGINLDRQLRVPQKDLRGRPMPGRQTSGGNVIEMPDKSLFVSMTGPYCKVFIVNRDKKILWSALPEKYDSGKNEWNPISEYRASIITRQQLEELISNSEKSE
jgi:arylsulfotransferase ASST